MKRSRLGQWVAAGAIIGAVLPMAACSPGLPAAANPVRVGAVYPLSGNQSEGGDELAGLKVAAGLVNADGGVHGRRVEITSEDAPGANDAAAAVDRLVDSGIAVIIGTYGSTQALTASARASQRGATFLETGAVADAVTGRGLPGILRTVATGSTLGRGGARWAHDFVVPNGGLQLAKTRVVVLFEGDQYGEAVGYGAIDEANKLGLNVVDSIKYDVASADYDGLARSVAADHPDIILTASYLEDAVAFRRAAVAHHIPLKTIIGTSSAYCRQDFGDILGSEAVGLFASDKPDEDFREDGLDPSARALLHRAVAAYHARTGKTMTAAAIAGFVGGWAMFHEILPRSASTSRADIWTTAMSLDLPLGSQINGAGLKFAGSGEPDAGQNRRAVSVIWEWVGVGHRAVVYPPTYAQAQPKILPVQS
jgi:ABC-type branched-subunit amino acid transport system substrate-binding protein